MFEYVELIAYLDYVYVYVCEHVYTRMGLTKTLIRAEMHGCIHTYTHIYIYVHIHIYICVYVCVHASMQICTYADV